MSEMPRERLVRGDRVRVTGGTYRGRTGRYVRNQLIQSGQLRVYLVVELDAGPRGGRARRHQFVSDDVLERIPDE
jgi:hypothetical protein